MALKDLQNVSAFVHKPVHWRLQYIAQKLRLSHGFDYGETFEQVLILGMRQLELIHSVDSQVFGDSMDAGQFVQAYFNNGASPFGAKQTHERG